jgi:hypothetical protein
MDAGAPEERESPWEVTFPKPYESGPGGHMVDIVSSGSALLSLSNLTRAGVETAGGTLLAGRMLAWLGRALRRKNIGKLIQERKSFEPWSTDPVRRSASVERERLSVRELEKEYDELQGPVAKIAEKMDDWLQDRDIDWMIELPKLVNATVSGGVGYGAHRLVQATHRTWGSEEGFGIFKAYDVKLELMEDDRQPKP